MVAAEEGFEYVCDVLYRRYTTEVSLPRNDCSVLLGSLLAVATYALCIPNW